MEKGSFSSARLNHKTFCPKRSDPSGSKGAQLKKHIDATLGSGNLREAVRLPPGEDVHEWFTVNTFWLFQPSEYIVWDSQNSAPRRAARQCQRWFFNLFTLWYEYYWADGVNIKKPIEVSAPKYVDYLMG